MLRPASLLIALAVVACGPVEPAATLPGSLTGDTTFVTQDPVIRVGQDMATFFRAPQAGQPAAAARAIAEIEWLADTLPRNPRWQTANSQGLTNLQLARRQARLALGIPLNAPTQPVIDGLASVAAGLEEGAAPRALPRAIFPLGPQETLQRLAAPPAVPNAMQAYWTLAEGPGPRRSR